MDYIYIIAVLAAVTSVWGPKWFLVLSIFLSFSSGFLIGIQGKNGNLVMGLFLGLILALASAVGGISSRYFRNRALERLRSRGVESLFPRIKFIQKREEEEDIKED